MYISLWSACYGTPANEHQTNTLNSCPAIVDIGYEQQCMQRHNEPKLMPV